MADEALRAAFLLLINEVERLSLGNKDVKDDVHWPWDENSACREARDASDPPDDVLGSGVIGERTAHRLSSSRAGEATPCAP